MQVVRSVSVQAVGCARERYWGRVEHLAGKQLEAGPEHLDIKYRTKMFLI